MSYFNNFPVVPYPVYNSDGSAKLVLLRDIALNVRFLQRLIDAVELYDDYDIQDGERPEVIAEKLYGDPTLVWVIMLFNQRYKYPDDFPMSAYQLEEYVEQKYGPGNRDSIHQLFGVPHYEDADGNPVDASVPLAVPVSNFEYEFRVNESKRRIRVPSPSLIPQISQELQSLFEQVIETDE